MEGILSTRPGSHRRRLPSWPSSRQRNSRKSSGEPSTNSAPGTSRVRLDTADRRALVHAMRGLPVTQAGRLIQASCTEGRRTGRHRRRLPPHGEGRSARFRARARGGSFGRDPRLGRWDGSAGDEGDGGASHRLLGRFLRWMQDRPPGVFVVATANDVASLPAEFLRKGRFDEIFFVDLPRLDQRREIFRLHLTKRHREPRRFRSAVTGRRFRGLIRSRDRGRRGRRALPRVRSRARVHHRRDPGRDAIDPASVTDSCRGDRPSPSLGVRPNDTCLKSASGVGLP